MAPRRVTVAFSGTLYLDPSTCPMASDADDGCAPHELARRTAAHCWPSVVAVNLPPDIGDYLPRLAATVMAELGKDVDLGGSVPKPAKDLWALTEAWLRAHRTTALIVSGCESLGVRLWEALASLASASFAVILVNRTSKLTRGHRRVLSRDEPLIERTDYATFFEWANAQIEGGAPRQTVAPSTPLPARFPAVPPDDVPFFIETSRRVLTEDEFDRVLMVYLHSFDAAVAWLSRRRVGVPEDVVGAFLAELIRDTTDIHAQVARLRGAQAGFWRSGRLLKLHADAFIAAHRTTPSTRDRDRELRILQSFLSPLVASAAVLTLQGRLTPAQLADLDTEQLRDDCGSLELDDGAIVNFVAGEAVLIRAHVLSTQHRGDLGGPLFRNQSGQRMRPSRVQSILHRAAVETGLPLTHVWSPPLDQRHANWLHRCGFSVHELKR